MHALIEATRSFGALAHTVGHVAGRAHVEGPLFLHKFSFSGFEINTVLVHCHLHFLTLRIMAFSAVFLLFFFLQPQKVNCYYKSAPTMMKILL